jgi:hypothetical protein
VAARRPRAAAQEILHYLQRAEDDELRGLAVLALSKAGTPARELARYRRDRPSGVPAHWSPSPGPSRWECDVRTRGA